MLYIQVYSGSRTAISFRGLRDSFALSMHLWVNGRLKWCVRNSINGYVDTLGQSAVSGQFHNIYHLALDMPRNAHISRQVHTVHCTILQHMPPVTIELWADSWHSVCLVAALVISVAPNLNGMWCVWWRWPRDTMLITYKQLLQTHFLAHRARQMVNIRARTNVLKRTGYNEPIRKQSRAHWIVNKYKHSERQQLTPCLRAYLQRNHKMRSISMLMLAALDSGK